MPTPLAIAPAFVKLSSLKEPICVEKKLVFDGFHRINGFLQTCPIATQKENLLTDVGINCLEQ